MNKYVRFIPRKILELIKNKKSQEVEKLITEHEIVDYTNIAIELVYHSDDLSDNEKEQMIDRILRYKQNHIFFDKYGYDYFKKQMKQLKQ